MNKLAYLEEIHANAMRSELEKIAKDGGILKRLVTPFERNPDALKAIKNEVQGSIKDIRKATTGHERLYNLAKGDFQLSANKFKKIKEKLRKKKNSLSLLERIPLTRNIGANRRLNQVTRMEASLLPSAETSFAEATKNLSKAERNLELRRKGVEKMVANTEGKYSKAVAKDAWKGVGNFTWRAGLLGGATSAVAIPVMKKRKEKRQMMGY